ncbi:MAG TPA: magnesium chelatase, partial [Negativicutes bacterium]|nr:magnesium chelatase [Negativicutes bacterium]
LYTALAVLNTMRKREKQMQPVLVLVTDGRANSGVAEGGDAVADALKAAGKIGMAAIPAVVIDTESDFVRLGVASVVARRMGAACYRLGELSDNNIIRIVKEMPLVLGVQ